MSNHNPQSGQPQQWWLSKHGTPTGPYDAAFIVEGLRSGKIPPDTLACLVGGKTWKRLNESATFGHACTPSPSAPSTPHQPTHAPVAGSTPSSTSPQANAPGPGPKQSRASWSVAAFVIIFLIVVVGKAVRGCNGPATGPNSPPSPENAPAVRLEDAIAGELQQNLNQSKQELFNGIHPVGTAKEVKVHEVEITWKHGQPTNRPEDVQTFNVRFTLYWEGPITKDGVTKVNATYDAESQRWMGMQILATNGLTNEKAGEAIGVLLFNYLNNNQ